MIFLEINLLNEKCAKVSLNSDECDEIGINYESFSPENISSRIFLASILSRLELMGITTDGSDKIVAEIFEQGDGSLIIYLSGIEFNAAQTQQCSVLFCKTPNDVISSLSQISIIFNCSLYRLSNGYALVSNEKIEGWNSSSIAAAKIKEYGRLLSDTPKALIDKLNGF